MDKNMKLSFSLLGGLMLMILNTNIFNPMILFLFSGNLDSKIMLLAFTTVNTILKLLALIGFIIVAVSSIKLIINNTSFKLK